MTSFFKIILIYWLLFSNFSWAQTKPDKLNKVSIAINSGIVKDFKRIDTHPCYKSDEFTRYSANKNLLTLNLLCRALRTANYPFKLDLVEVPNVARGYKLLAENKVHIQLSLRKDRPPAAPYNFTLSAPVLKNYQEYSAFFAHEKNKDAMKSRTLEELTQLQAALPNNWHWQRKVLEQLNIRYQTVKYRDIAKFLYKYRADVVLLQLTGKKPLEKKLNNKPLVATGGVYFIERVSYYLPLAAKKEGSKELAQALSVGLNQLRRTGVINKLFGGLVVNSEQLNDWAELDIGQLMTGK